MAKTATIKKRYKAKRLFFNNDRKLYCVVRMYATEKEMKDGYLEWQASKGKVLGVEECDIRFEGIHCGFSAIKVLEDGREFMCKSCGEIFLYWDSSDVGIVTHELLHAAIWAFQFKYNKDQYPFVLKSMDDEESMIMMHTRIVWQYYRWHWKDLEKKLKNLNK